MSESKTTPDFDAHVLQEVQTLYGELEHKFEPSNAVLYEMVREYLYKDWRKKHGV